MQKMINRFGYKKSKWGMIALVIVLTIICAASIALAIITYRNFNTYTTITM